MLSLPTPTRVYVYTAAADMRKSFAGLVGLVEREMGRQVEQGGLFLFFNRRRDSVKALFFTGDGLAIFYRRLERGTFETPRAEPDAVSVEIAWSDLTLILAGIELQSVRRRKRWPGPAPAA